MDENKVKLFCGDSLVVLKDLPDNSIDAVVTDPPYGLGKEPNTLEMIKAWSTTGYLQIKGKGFMGKEWDAFVPQPLFWKEVYRVLKPGGHVLSFFGTRTYDWGVLAVRLAGFEIRDQIQWLYGSGIELSPEYFEIAKGRMKYTEAKLKEKYPEKTHTTAKKAFSKSFQAKLDARRASSDDF